MSPTIKPAIAGGNEVLSLLQLLHNQPPSPTRDHLIQEANKKLLGLSSNPSVIGLDSESACSETELDQVTAGLPPLIRLPKPGARCPHTGLSRTGLVELIAPCQRNNEKPPVSAVYKRSHPRAKRGVWHIPTRSLFRYLLEQRELTAESYAVMQQVRKESEPS